MASAEELSFGCDHVERFEELKERLTQGRPLRVKFGLDPTSADLHLGHAVVLGRLQRWIEAGHEATLVIGDFTARIGDPSGRNEARPPLSDEMIEENMKTYAAQAGKILDIERVTLRRNSEWLGAIGFDGLIRLLSHVTVAQMLKRDDFANRFRANQPIALHEFLYPIAQAYDSVALESDVELGGNDQLFNVLMGRFYQGIFAQAPQICMTLPLLEGIDGAKKMSKSAGNAIGLTDPPSEQFGKTMSIPDELIARWELLVLGNSAERSAVLAAALADGSLHPMTEKKRIAEAIVTRFHGTEAGRRAREEFERTIQRGEAPQEMAEVAIPAPERLATLLVRVGFAESKRAAERSILSGGVRIDGVTVLEGGRLWTERSGVLSIGNRRYVRIVLPEEKHG
jgi:tyrosyl-tRNA synthetase